MFRPAETLHNRYQLQRQLGKTAAGRQTWLATDLKSQESVTVKLLAFSPQMHWDELKLFEREAEILQALNHPCIPRYRDYFSLDKIVGDGVPWFGLVQDYIPGFSLQELLDKKHRFWEKEVKEIAANILKILVYLHELSPPVLHRDIKPSNLILGNDHNIYLVDFGAVQAQAAVTGVTFTVVGTSGYAPLEQFWGRAVPASDLYALGATLIHLVTGINPADLQKGSRLQFADKVSLQPDLVQWLESLTEMDLEKRIKTARAALETLRNPRVSEPEKLSRFNLKVPQPTHTPIQVLKSGKNLEILIPAGFANRLGLRGLFGLLCNLWFSYLVFQVPFLIPVGVIILAFSAIDLMKSIGESRSITFSPGYFKIKSELYGFKFWVKQGDIHDISAVYIYQNGGQHHVMLRCRRAWNPNPSYTLISGAKENECAWLTSVIQDWLLHH